MILRYFSCDFAIMLHSVSENILTYFVLIQWLVNGCNKNDYTYSKKVLSSLFDKKNLIRFSAGLTVGIFKWLFCRSAFASETPAQYGWCNSGVFSQFLTPNTALIDCVSFALHTAWLCLLLAKRGQLYLTRYAV